jgi:heptosyltransferase-2
VDPALNPESVLVIAPNWVGDSIFMLPAVSALRRHFVTAKIGLLARPSILALHRGSRAFDAFEALDISSRSARFASHWRLRPRHYDVALLFPPSFSSALGAFLSGAKLRLGRSGEGRGIFINRLLPKARRDRHVSEEYLDLARLAGAEPDEGDRMPRLALTSEGIEEQKRLFAGQGLPEGAALVALCPTSAFGPSKCWGGEKFAALARLLRLRGLQPCLFGAPSELAQLEPIAEAAGGLPILLPGLAGLAACLAVSGAVVANDSGPLHIAAALGARCVGIYGPVDPKWSAPLSERCRVLYSSESCSPCFKPVCPLGHHNCMAHISPEAVLGALEELLSP